MMVATGKVENEDAQINDGSSSSYSSSRVGGNDNDDVEQSSNGETSTSVPTTHHTNEITRNETRNVSRLRHVVILMLIAKAVVVCWIVYAVQKSRESAEFANQYEAATSKIIESYEGIVHKMGAIGGLGVQLTSQSVEEGTPFPFVSLPHFHLRAQNAKDLSGALAVTINPVVHAHQFQKWDEFVNDPHNNAWIKEISDYQDALGINQFGDDTYDQQRRIVSNRTVDVMRYFNASSMPVPEDGLSESYYLPQWQGSPLAHNGNRVNVNSLRQPQLRDASFWILQHKTAFVGSFLVGKPGTISNPHPVTSLLAFLMSAKQMKEVSYEGDPLSPVHFPIFDSFQMSSRRVVAMMSVYIHWASYLQNILPSISNCSLYVVLENSCQGPASPRQFTYIVQGEETHVVGIGDHHESQFESHKRVGYFGSEVVKDGTLHGVFLNNSLCDHQIRVYPTQEFYNDLITSGPLNFTLAIAVLYIVVIFMFLFYDFLVEKRQRIVLDKATKSTAIVSSLFPKKVRDQLMEAENTSKDQHLGLGIKNRLTNILKRDATHDLNTSKDSHDEPIAELFPECTVFFADIVGFTAWSSAREPCQVFVLLQALYQAFDEIARRRRVFKVETIGDSYVAVTGLPEPQKYHAIVMIRFAMECLEQMHSVTQNLECSLGPGTSKLTMRMGAHSGPVTAGVIKAERARFQLFGDTVNTASRMESTGCPGRMQVSEATATLLRAAGKEGWLERRPELVYAKGKGQIQTYFVATTPQGSSCSSDCSKLHCPQRTLGSENVRLINWISELLVANIQRMVQHRRKCGIKDDPHGDFIYQLPSGRNCMDEVLEAIEMPTFKHCAVGRECATEAAYVEMTAEHKELVKALAAEIASLYEATNSFHNFEHACHVTMSVVKLLNRVNAPDISPDKVKDQADLGLQLHDYTHGIYSDPLTHFAMAWSSLIHDVNHRGVSNGQMATEEPAMAGRYNHKSIAEQNSLDLAWQVLMQSRFRGLRRYMFGTESELLRFRQLVVNVVLATDIFDRELNDLRKARWKKAFPSSGEDIVVDLPEGRRAVSSIMMGSIRTSDIRATIVLEHIIQASDVAHTMQHWHVYQKWNRKLLVEMHAAYKAGRMERDPLSFWYDGELGFFDNYIIPLAKKLKECGVFGVSGDEYYNYAVENRDEWSLRGKEIVAGFKKQLMEGEQAAAATKGGGGTGDEEESTSKTYFA